jgi:hypothetical protein
MGRSLELSGKSILYVFNAASLAVILVVLALGDWSFGVGGIALAVLVGSLLVATAIAAWRRRTDRDDDHLGTDEDLAYDPIAYPGQAARREWEKAVRRLPGGDDEEN